MKKNEFKSWLESVYRTPQGKRMVGRAIGSRVSNCLRIENVEGDLDDHFAADKGRILIQRLEYGADDEKAGLAAKHDIPIQGKIREGTATFKAAAMLYFKFAEDKGLPATGVQPLPAPDERPAPKGWPDWGHPTDDEILGLARIIARYARFLAPEIVQAVVQDNERQRVEWLAALARHGIDGGAYLWERSSCAFPGVRRYAGSQEIAIFRKKASGEGFKIPGALRLDDNDFPKQIWSHVFLGKKFNKQGPAGYALAHLADHKNHGNRHDSDFQVQGDTKALHGLFAAVTNSVYVPVGLIKPTDFGKRLRNLLMRRATALYGLHCNLLPSWLAIEADLDPQWALDQFDWAEPVGDCSRVGAFLTYRNSVIDAMFEG